MRKRTFKVLTLLLLFIFLTSFLLSYSHTMMTTTWFPKQMVLELSENFRKLMSNSHRPCTCARCIGQRRVSSWFDERFNWSMQPLLTMQNALLEEETYSWWLVRAGLSGDPGLSGRPRPWAVRDSQYWSSVHLKTIYRISHSRGFSWYTLVLSTCSVGVHRGPSRGLGCSHDPGDFQSALPGGLWKC